MTKSLGQIAFESTIPAEFNFPSSAWADMLPAYSENYELMAEAVAAHVRAEMAAEAVPLTDAEIKDVCSMIYASDYPQGNSDVVMGCGAYELAIARAIEAALIAKQAATAQPVGCVDAPAVQLGPKLFSFASHQNWVDSASIAWNSHCVKERHTVCVDQLGRLLGWGQHFATARDEGQFPVDVYLLRADMANPPQPEQLKGQAK